MADKKSKSRRESSDELQQRYPEGYWDNASEYLQQCFILQHNEDYLEFLVTHVWKLDEVCRLAEFGCGCGKMGLKLMPLTWREAYRKFGAKPKDYPSSIENLTRRVLNGATIGHINNLVSLYNTISLRYILPVGGEDLDKIVGDVLLTWAGHDEPDIYLLGEKEARAPRPGEIIYKDDGGAICRRWNWKEADRTKLTKGTRNAVLVIETLPPVRRDIVETAIRELAELVNQYCGGTVSTAVLDKDNRAIKLI